MQQDFHRINYKPIGDFDVKVSLDVRAMMDEKQQAYGISKNDFSYLLTHSDKHVSYLTSQKTNLYLK